MRLLGLSWRSALLRLLLPEFFNSSEQFVQSGAHQQNPRLRNKEFVQSLCADGALTGVLRVPDAIADIAVTADVRISRVVLHTTLAAPNDRTPRVAVVWLTRQLKSADGSLLVDAYARNAKHPVTASLEQLRDDPRNGLGPAKQMPARFQLRYSAPMGQGRRSTRKKGFIDSEAERIGERIRCIRARPWPERPVSAANKSGKHPAATRQAVTYPRSLSVLDAVIGFYGDVLQDLKPFVPRAPAIDRRNIPASTADTPNNPPHSSGGADAATAADASSR